MATKNPPVDRGKLLIGLECCQYLECEHCPYNGMDFGCAACSADSMEYIGWLEEQLEGASV